MQIMVSAIITFCIISFFLIWCIYKSYKEEVKAINDVFYGFYSLVYHFFMFLSVATYILVYMLFPTINALVYIVILLAVIKGADFLAKKCVVGTDVLIDERKISVVVSSIVAGGVLVVCALTTGNVEYWNCAGVAFSVILGFFIPLEVLVGDDDCKAIRKKIKQEFIISKEGMKRTIKASIGLVLVVVITYISPFIIGENARDKIHIGFAIGIILFLGVWLFILLVWPKGKKIDLFLKNKILASAKKCE